MATATTIPTTPQNSSYRGVLRGRRKDSTPTLFPDVPIQRDTGPDALLPPGSRPERVGIARLASSSPLADAKRGTEYFLLPVRSILNHCDSDRVPFSWTVNPIVAVNSDASTVTRDTHMNTWNWIPLISNGRSTSSRMPDRLPGATWEWKRFKASTSPSVRPLTRISPPRGNSGPLARFSSKWLRARG